MIDVSKQKFAPANTQWEANFYIDPMPKGEDERFVVESRDIITVYAPTRALALKGLHEKLAILQAQITAELESKKP